MIKISDALALTLVDQVPDYYFVILRSKWEKEGRREGGRWGERERKKRRGGRKCQPFQAANSSVYQEKILKGTHQDLDLCPAESSGLGGSFA